MRIIDHVGIGKFTCVRCVCPAHYLPFDVRTNLSLHFLIASSRIEFEKGEKRIAGKVVHHTGKVLIQVSQNDESLQDILFGFVFCLVINLDHDSS